MVSDQDVARAAEIIQQGGLVAFPTETVYGLGANALDINAVQRIYRAKGRPLTSPLIVHVAELHMAKSLAAEWPRLADVLAKFFWPGPLTMVLRKARVVPDLVTARTDTIGIRIPAHRIATDLILRALRPIAAPSANRFTEVSPTTADHVRISLGDRVDMILDGGPTQVGIESTVVSLAGNEPEILRPGMISREELKAVTGLEWPVRNSTGHASASPGLHPKHYSPRTPLYVLRPGQPLPRGRGRMLEMPFSASEYAETLYAQLHKADIEGWDWIGVEEPPDNPEWEGIRDRLRRASTR